MENKSYVFNCSCKSCILNEVSKFEQKKLYEEADRILNDGIKYHSQLISDLQEERNKLRSRQKYDTQPSQSTSKNLQKSYDAATCVGSSDNKNCLYAHKTTFHHVSKRPKDGSFWCPIAVFEDANPRQKPMYPKHLVYANGQDTQLEEILAANWDSLKNLKPRIQSEAPKELRPENIVKRTSDKNHKNNISELIENSWPSPVTNAENKIPEIRITKETESDARLNRKTTLLVSTNMIKRTEYADEKQSIPSGLTEKKRRRTEFVDESKCNTVRETKNVAPTNTKDAEETENIEILKRTSVHFDVVDNISELLEHLWPSPVTITEDVCRPNSDCLKSKPETKSKEVRISVDPTNNDNKENVIPTKIPVLWNDDDEDLDTSDTTCNTKAFAVVLPSSTPNRRKSQVFQHSNINGTYTCEPQTNTGLIRQSIAGITVPNLSMILEMSKERSSSSSGSSVNNNINSKTFVVPEKTILSAIDEADEKDVTRTRFENFADPFDPNLIEYFLKKMNFPFEQHSEGFRQINLEMPFMKQSSTIKLGTEKYAITGEIGKGSYARILKAHTSNKHNLVALKLQKPACTWEFYISKEIQRRLKSEEKSHYFIQYSHIFVFKNGSTLMSEWAPYGSLLSFINTLRTSNYHHFRCPSAVATYFGIQLISAVEYLHSCQIIHGDIKPDNFVICSSDFLSTKPCVQLIDYGRSIDMTLFPKNTVFYKVVTTEDFTCNEMKENKPWTYQTDLFGLAGTMYLLLVGDYMKTTKQNGVWVLKKPLARYMHKDIWDPIFDTLLNVPSCNDQPNLSLLKQRLENFYQSLDKFTINQQFNQVSKMFKK